MIMLSRRLAIVVLTSMPLSGMLAPAWADEVHVVQSTPAARAVIDGRSSAFFVRFDRQVDHVHSTLSITRDETRSTTRAPAGIGGRCPVCTGTYLARRRLQAALGGAHHGKASTQYRAIFPSR